MDIVKINGASFLQSDSARKEVLALSDRKIILKDDIPVFQFIDSAGFDGNAIHKVRVAKEILFACNTYLKHKPSGKVLLTPESFSGLVRYLDEEKLPDYRFVLDTTDKELLSRLIQQLIYLDIDIEVMLSSEEAEVRKMELFARLSGELQHALEDAKGRMCRRGGGSETKEYMSNALHVLSNIETNLREMLEKDLKVAIMALKKSGKSVVVNCLMGGDYAPASIELPTFTTCIYRKSRDKSISLRYKDKTTYFESPDALKKHIAKEFKALHTDKGAEHTSGDMDISYLPREGNICNYTIIDTPGPDLAGHYHKDIAYRWIKEADVILFIIDYSKYLTSSEEEFFRDIKKVFEEHQKFYSFIVVVNKLDLMYLSEEKKSSTRFIDFLRTKLSDLGYRGFVVFGVSALQYLYSQVAPEIEGCRDLDTDEGKKLRGHLNRCLQRYQGKDEMTVLSFLDSQLRNLFWFHGKENATLRDLREKSGVGQLMKYINYIAMEKAHIELFNHKLSVVERALEDFQSGFIRGMLARLEEDSNTLGTMIDDISCFSGEMLAAARQEFHPEDIQDRIDKDLALARKSLYKVLNMQMESIEKQLVKVLKSLSDAELISFQKGNRLKAIDEMSCKFEKNVIAKLYQPVFGKHCGSLNKEITARNKALDECKDRIQEKVEDLNKHLRKDYGFDCSGIRLSPMAASFTGFDFAPIIMKLDSPFTQSLIKERLSRKRGMFGSLIFLLTLGLVDMRTGGFKFDDVKLRKALLIERKYLDHDTQRQVDEMHEKLSAHVNSHLRDLESALHSASEHFETNCKKVFSGFLSDLKTLRGDVEAKVGFLKEVESSMEHFHSLWSRVKESDTQ